MADSAVMPAAGVTGAPQPLQNTAPRSLLRPQLGQSIVYQGLVKW